MPSDSYDAIIIGSGPNGLAAAIRLAQKGWKVLVLEAASTTGGGTRTKELTLPGFQHDVCSAVHPMGLGSPYLRALGPELEKHGLRWIQPDHPLAHPLEGGRAAVLHRSLEDTAASLGKDTGKYRFFFKTLVEHAHELYGDMLAPAGFPKHPYLMARLGMGAGLPATWFAKYFTTEEGRALFGGCAAHSIMALHLPLTSAIGVVLQLSGHAVGWPIPEGGSQRITDAMVSLLRSLGGEVQCDTPVKSLADLPPAKAYLFDLSPTNVSRICGDALPANYRSKLERFRHGPGVFKVDYALSSPIPWTNAECCKAGTVHVGGSMAEMVTSERDAWEGRLNDAPFVLLAQPSIHDATRAPAGKHVAWAYCHVPAGSTEDRLEIINKQIERFAPGFRDCIMAHHTMNCAEMEAYNPNYIGGDVIGGITDWRQLFTRPVGMFNPYATPNSKIFLCSASTPPGGGVHGMCGYWAAESVVKRVKR
jgi:phytoene dehydrogenase-like protein